MRVQHFVKCWPKLARFVKRSTEAPGRKARHDSTDSPLSFGRSVVIGLLVGVEIKRAATKIDAQVIGRIVADERRLRVKAVNHKPTLLLGLRDARATQDPQMVRNLRNIVAQLCGQFADARGPFVKLQQDPQAVGIGKRLQSLGAFLKFAFLLHFGITYQPPARCETI